MYFEQTMARGDSGEQVTQLQEWLRELGHYAGMIDGDFGEATEFAVQRFQESAGLERDGQVQEQTWQTLDLHAGYQSEARPESTADRQLSEDGQWQWDGAEWQPVEGQSAAGSADTTLLASVEVGVLSEDGQWQWDGQRWLAAPAGGGAKLIPGQCNHPDYPADQLSDLDIAQLAKDAGFTGKALVTAVAVAKAESGGDRTCYSSTHDLGLWQINKMNWDNHGGKDALYDAANNAKAAFNMWSTGKTFRWWKAYTNGKYKDHLAAAQAAVNQLP